MKPQLWWDMSERKEKKPYGHSVEFLQKQAEKAADVETGMDKFDLVNRPYFVPLPEDWMYHKHLNIPRGRNKHSALETSLVRLAKRYGQFIAQSEPVKKQKTNISLKNDYQTENKEEKIVEIPDED